MYVNDIWSFKNIIMLLIHNFIWIKNTCQQWWLPVVMVCGKQKWNKATNILFWKSFPIYLLFALFAMICLLWKQVQKSLQCLKNIQVICAINFRIVKKKVNKITSWYYINLWHAVK